MNEKDKQKLEQVLASVRDTIPRMLWALYNGSKDAGFSESQSFKIVLAYVAGLAQNTGDPPEKDD